MSDAPRAAAERAAGVLPEPLLERARLLEALRLQARVRRSPAIRGAAIVWHAITTSPMREPLLEIDPPLQAERFEQIAGYLARHYALVRAADLPAAARSRQAGDRVPIALTFDDDLASHRDHAARILERHDARATAFLCGTDEPFWWQLLQVAIDEQTFSSGELPGIERETVAAALARQPRAIRRLAKAIEDLPPRERDAVTARLREAVPELPPTLGRDGAQALASSGWEIGFHTRRHDLLTALDDDALRAALDPQQAGGARTLAYPHGKATAREARAARAAGYVAAYTGRDEVYDERTDDHLIGRLQPDTDTLGRFALHLARALSAPS
jgi:peptidoglycan/xylan/chitin deacetylase (PgdA/CDA1 family)